jgi:hypothetical protein
VNTICSRKYAAGILKTANAGTVNTGSSRHCKHDPGQALETKLAADTVHKIRSRHWKPTVKQPM